MITFPGGMWVYYYFDGVDRPKWVSTLMQGGIEMTSVVSFKPDQRKSQEYALLARALVCRGIEPHGWAKFYG